MVVVKVDLENSGVDLESDLDGRRICRAIDSGPSRRVSIKSIMCHNIHEEVNHIKDIYPLSLR